MDEVKVIAGGVFSSFFSAWIALLLEAKVSLILLFVALLICVELSPRLTIFDGKYHIASSRNEISRFLKLILNISEGIMAIGFITIRLIAFLISCLFLLLLVILTFEIIYDKPILLSTQFQLPIFLPVHLWPFFSLFYGALGILIADHYVYAHRPFWSDWERTSPQAHLLTRYCRRCSEIETFEDGHSGRYEYINSTSCEQEQVCVVCKEIFGESKLMHNWGPPQQSKDHPCGHYTICNRCGERHDYYLHKDQLLEELRGESYEGGYDPPSLWVDKTYKYRCSRCGYEHEVVHQEWA